MLFLLAAAIVMMSEVERGIVREEPATLRVTQRQRSVIIK
jgi:Na+-transporting methylmalonyl-CoA/oxaloacetate decarboxylase gamma subunit